MTQAHYAQQQSHLPRPATSAHGSGVGTSTSPGPMLGDVPYGGEVPPDPRWMLRLRELESKLKLEREGRNMDRSAAKQRLTEQEDENRTLREENARMRRANGSPKMK